MLVPITIIYYNEIYRFLNSSIRYFNREVQDMIDQFATERLIIRRFHSGDCCDAHEYLRDEEVMKYVESPFSYQQSEEFVNLFACENPRVYALLEKASRKVIGHVIFHPYQHATVYEIGCILNKNYQGKGYSLEISRALIKYGFEALKLHRIFASTVKGNIASCHLLQKLGMQKGAIFRKANFYNGNWIDEYWYAILAEDYFKNAPMAY
jgi:[ribosomal protein S5]-alanine N-acetyltransferase